MIGEYTLEMLCNKYNLSKDKLIKKNRNILDYGEYKEIDETLNYLINKLRIQPENIEKCPSILYRNVNQIVNNINFLKEQKINFSEIESCLHVLSTEYKRLIETYNYVESNYGLQAINKNTSILSCPIKIILSVENLNLNRDFNLTICVSIGFGKTTLEEIQKIIQSKEYQEHPELFTSTTLAYATLEEIQKIIQSKEYQEHPELFTSEVLAHAKLEEIQKIIQSKEYQEHPELFTSQTLAHSKLEEIQKIIQSKEYQEHPELFTSEVLAHATLEEIQKIIQSKEYQEHPELFTSQTLARAKFEEIQKIIQSKEYQEHPELFTSTTLAHAKLEEIQKIIQSKEYQEHPELFTSEVLAHATLEEIQKIIQSKEYQEHPDLFTSTTLAHAKLEDVQKLLSMDCWNDERYRRLLTSSVVAKSKSIISKLPILFDIAEEYGLTDYLNTSFMLVSPNKNYALIKYLEENNLKLIIDGKLNPVFGKTEGLLKKKYNIDIGKYMKKYSLEEFKFGGKRL